MSCALRAVLEVAPWRLSDRPLPDVAASREHPREWSGYFAACLADAGFADVVPLAPGSHFVLARSLEGHPLLARLLADSRDDDGSFLPLDAGYALFVDGALVFEPGCCSDLGTLRDWERLLVERPEKGELWVGHPLLSVAFEGAVVRLKEQWDGPGAAPRPLHEVSLPVASLEVAVRQARDELSRFALVLAESVAPMVATGTSPDAIAATLMNLAPA